MRTIRKESSKSKLFIDNFLIYGLGGIIGKVIPLIMVPIVTRLMPDSKYFGISDMSNTLVSFGSALAIMGMYDAVFRLFFDKDDEEYREQICSTALIFTLVTSIVISFLMIIYRKKLAQWFFDNTNYSYLVYISAIATLFGATNNIISAPTRMQNQRKIYLITNTLSSLISYGISIPLLLTGHFLIALPLASMISSIIIEMIFFTLNHKWFNLKRFDSGLLKELLKLAAPLLPNVLIYWVFNSSDRLMITHILGTHESGIYAVGAKLGAASQLIYTAFAGGWQYFAFSTMKENDQVKSNSLIFEYLGEISFIATMFVCALSWPIYQFLFEGSYQQGFIVAPYLFFAPLVQMLEQVIGNQFLVIKKAWPTMLILSGGALVNIVLNALLIPAIGIEGAAIATLIGYISCVIACSTVLIKMNLLIIEKRFYISAALIAVYMIIWRIFLTTQIMGSLIFATGVAILYLFLYKQEVVLVINKIKYLRKGKK